MQKLYEIEQKLNKDYLNIKNRYVRLKRCKYILLILKTILISLSISLSFLNPLIIIVSSTVPIIDSIMLITEKDKKVCDLKLQKDIINQIIKEIEIKRYTFNNDEEIEKYIIEVYGKIQTFLCKICKNFAKFFLRSVDLSVDIVRKILDFYMS